MSTATVSTTPKGKKAALVAVCVAMVLTWFVIPLGYAELRSIHNGYGTGFHNQLYVPEKVKKEYNLPANATVQTVMDRTATFSGGGVWHDGWRYLVALTAFVLMLAGFYFVQSRLTF